MEDWLRDIVRPNQKRFSVGYPGAPSDSDQWFDTEKEAIAWVEAEQSRFAGDTLHAIWNDDELVIIICDGIHFTPAF